MKRFVLLLAAVMALACGSDGGDAGGSKPKGGLVFEPEATPAGMAVTLRQKELGKDRLVLELVGHSLADLYGVAFRLSYDPATLAFEKLEASPAWPGSPPIALGSAKTPGLLVGTVTEKGKAAGVSGGEVVLGTLTFALTQQKPGAIDFVADRSALVATSGKRVSSVGWAGGELVRK